MKALASERRKQLGKTVLQAREAAEIGARKALEALGVHEPEPYKHFNEEQRLLRRALRAQARQLGDEESRTKKGSYEIAHLKEKVAYDQWHRLLFARFLIENNLLLSPEHGIAVTFHDCEELASMIGLPDGWAIAARFAATELPEIFRMDDPTGSIDLPVEDRKQLVQLVTNLPTDVFLADDSLGWVYQFWQAKRKEEVNESGTKIGADELAPVTQLFTEDYMVLFLLHNTIGAWWAGKVAQADPRKFKVETEEDARKAAELPGVEWTYLRFIRHGGPSPPEGEGKGEGEFWAPAAGSFDGWPKTAKEIRVLDPCMGSGHFLVAELPILVAMRMAEEKLAIEEAVLAVLRDNLYGLELDLRCTQIAAFNLAMAAWKLAGYQKLSPLNLACSGLAPRTKLELWTKLANGNQRLREGMERLYHLFEDGPTVGSLINPRKFGGDLLTAEFHELQPLLQKALEREDERGDETGHELTVTAQGIAHAAEILATQFTLVATNVPFLGGYKQCITLAEHLATAYENAGGNLANAFLMRITEFLARGHTLALVTPQDWMLLGRYTKLREFLLPRITARALAFLGAHAFETIQGEVVTAGLSIWDNNPFHIGDGFGVLALSAQVLTMPIEKARFIVGSSAIGRKQSEWFLNPNKRITVEAVSSSSYLSAHARPWQGLKTSDDDRFVCCFWETPQLASGWRFYIRALSNGEFSGREHVLLWEDGVGQLRQLNASQSRDRRRDQQGSSAWGKTGIAVNTAGRTISGVFFGESFASEVVVMTAQCDHLTPILAFTRSSSFADALRKLDKRVSITTSTFTQVPFDLAHWQKVAAEKYPDGLPKPYSNEPTQWLFNGHPKDSTQPLQVAVARLLGYRWPRQTGSSFPDCPALAPDGLEKFADADGIVCISPIKGEDPAAERLRALLAAVYGSEWTAMRQAELLAQVDCAGKSLEDWLRNGFFEQHCAVFHHRPFIWHIWDGRKDGFSALVNYHLLTKANLEKLTYSYLGDWIGRQKAAVSAGESGSDARLQAANGLQGELQKILEGEPPYDIFVRWKPIEKQPIGWDPDLNDGVRLNIRPFMSAKDVGKKSAGILRAKPNIHWKKDRGTDVASAPWFKVFKGERINDHHLTLDEKRKARHSSDEPGSARIP
ncbi:MAG: BREX-1 system adenine-specific DNA-methyltransferase PglX [Nitrospira sp.]|nr:BREX-1 system adenine-specific DNA-methyltransferase PglX [Nitrospira sp.]